MKGSRSCTEILTQIGSLVVEALACMDAEASATPKSVAKRTTAKRRTRNIVRPAGESDELASAQARRLLRQHGFREVAR